MRIEREWSQVGDAYAMPYGKFVACLDFLARAERDADDAPPEPAADGEYRYTGLGI